MRKLMLGTATAIVITLTGLQGTALAATPDSTVVTARQFSITIENETLDSSDLSNMPEMSSDDSDNDG